MNQTKFNYEEELSKCTSMNDITGENGLVQKIIKNAMETLLQNEFNNFINQNNTSKNYRNGYNKKNIKTEYGDIQINMPRDRNGEFSPEILAKRATISDGIKDQITSMYAKGMSTRDITNHIEGMYGTELSATTVSNITDEAMVNGKEWFNRTLDSVYPIVFMDAVHFKVREENKIVSKAIYVALGITMDGMKDVIGMWIGENEGAKFWFKVCTELKNRGVKDILIACVDGLKGFPDAIKSVFPDTAVQLCIIHQIRNSFKYISWKDQKEFISDLKGVYKATNEELGLETLNEMYNKWGNKYGMVLDSWMNNWENLSTFFEYEDRIRKLIYTTNTVEGFNRQLRKVTKTKTVFPNDDAVLKAMYLATMDISKKWTSPYSNWGLTLAQFKINFGDRLPIDLI